jgi:hypothetical protein
MEWPDERIGELQRSARRLHDAAEELDVLKALACIEAANTLLGELAGDLCEIGARDGGYSQKALAAALGVPPSVLRGLKASVR